MGLYVVKKMKIKEYLSMVYLNITRKGLKNNLYIATFICTILFFTLFVFWENVNKIISVTLKNEIGYRTIDVLPRFDSQDLTYDEINNKLDDEINEIMKINNIIDAFNSNEWNIVLTSDLDNQYVDGTITLLRGTKKLFLMLLKEERLMIMKQVLLYVLKIFIQILKPLKLIKKEL